MIRATKATRQNERANLEAARDHFAAMLAGNIPLPPGWNLKMVTEYLCDAEARLRAIEGMTP